MKDNRIYPNKYITQNELMSFTTEKLLHKKGCVMCEVNDEYINSLRNEIDLEDYWDPKHPTMGFQDHLHITLHYGMHPNVPAKAIYDKLNYTTFPVLITGYHIFNNSSDYEVLVLKVSSMNVIELNKSIIELPCEIKFPEYVPHITLAYLKPGRSQKWIKNIYKLININIINYSEIFGDSKNLDQRQWDFYLPNNKPII